MLTVFVTHKILGEFGVNALNTFLIIPNVVFKLLMIEN